MILRILIFLSLATLVSAEIATDHYGVLAKPGGVNGAVDIGTVLPLTSITGTAGQITVTPGSSTAVISLPATITSTLTFAPAAGAPITIQSSGNSTVALTTSNANELIVGGWIRAIAGGYGLELPSDNAPIAIGADLGTQLVRGNANGIWNFTSMFKLAPIAAPGTPLEGMVYADSTSHHLYYYDNGPTARQLDQQVEARMTTADLLAQSATVSSVVTTTTPNDGSPHQYAIGVYTAITAISAGTLTVQVTFTDENSTSQTLSFFAMGLTSAGLTTTGFTAFSNSTIRAKANTAITLKTTFTGVSVTYDIGGSIQRVN